MRARAALIYIILGATTAPASAAAEEPPRQAPAKWQGAVPRVAQDQQSWIELTDNLLAAGAVHGALAAARRMLILFDDVPVKEQAFRTIISVIDRGYPFPATGPFLAGDIDPAVPSGKPGSTDDHEARSLYNHYHLYKAQVNRERSATRWADGYLARVETFGFPKLQLAQAIEDYLGDRPDEAIEKIKKLLGTDFERAQTPFVRKAARTLARIHFEREQYEKALEIYTSFLLRLNPVSPSDWVDAAWTYFHLKRYPEAIGALYNLESRAAEGSVNIEKYVIRALIYRSLCDLHASEELIKSFKSDYERVIRGIKTGEPLSRHPELVRVETQPGMAYRQAAQTISGLQSELGLLDGLPADQKAVAAHLYKTESAIQKRKAAGLRDLALESAAQQLIGIEEQLRFLKFDVVRERFNPDAIFKPADVTERALIEDLADDSYRLRWKQLGDFWRDERSAFAGILENRCGQQ